MKRDETKNQFADNEPIVATDESCVCVSACDDDSAADSESGAEYKKLAAEMTYQAQRVQAEFDNYRKRTAESSRLAKEDGRAEVVERLLPVLDSFGGAFKIIKDENVLNGIRLIFNRMMSELSQFGLSKIEDLAEFDPTYHNAVMAREEGESGRILEVLQDGYMLKNKVLRATSVIVSS